MQYLSKRLALTILVCSLSLLIPFNMAFPEMTKDEQEAKKLVVTYFKALNEGNAEKIGVLYHRDSVFLPNNAPAVRGIDEIRNTYQNLFKKIKLDTKHVYHHVSVHEDLAIVESKAEGTLTLLETKTNFPANDNELFVLRKIEGAWKIDRYMFNASEHH